MIYFVRHGETDFNLFGITEGQLNTSLNTTGLKQAKEVAQKMKDLKLDIIFSSPINRAKQTAEEINAFHKKEIIFDERIMEISKGVLQGKLNPAEIYKDFFKTPHKYYGEDFFDVHKRVSSFIKDLEKYKNKEVLIVSHGGVLGFFYFCLSNKDILKEEPELMRVGNGEIIKIDF